MFTYGLHNNPRPKESSVLTLLDTITDALDLFLFLAKNIKVVDCNASTKRGGAATPSATLAYIDRGVMSVDTWSSHPHRTTMSSLTTKLIPANKIANNAPKKVLLENCAILLIPTWRGP